MTCRGCKSFLASILKFLTYLQTFVGVAIILYSLWMFSHWNHHDHIPPTSAPSPESAYSSMLNLFGSEPKNRKLVENSEHILFDKLAGLMSSHLEAGSSSSFKKLPRPWFIYSSMSNGITLCLINFIGYIAAESINGCCLLFILLNQEKGTRKNVNWVLPHDPIFKKILKFVGMVVIIIQVLSLLLAIILRAMVTRRADYDSENEDDYLSVNHRRPLMIPQGEQSSASTSEDSKTARPDAWSWRMREKYGLNPHEFGQRSGSKNISGHEKQRQ